MRCKDHPTKQLHCRDEITSATEQWNSRHPTAIFIVEGLSALCYTTEIKKGDAANNEQLDWRLYVKNDPGDENSIPFITEPKKVEIQQTFVLSSFPLGEK